MEILEIKDSAAKSRLAGEILQKLPDWFGIEEALNSYISDVSDKIFYAGFDDGGKCLGFFAGDIHYRHAGELFVLGIEPKWHGKGIGTAIYQVLERRFLLENCDTIIVKTISESHSSKAYEETRKFYSKMGFVPLLELPELWGEKNPCLVMEKRLKCTYT